jgi:hypothetical protein
MKTTQNKIEPVDEETQYLIDQTYSIPPLKMRLPDGSLEEINPDGNLGLLAFGYTGIVAWRRKREELYGEKIYSPLIDFIKMLMEKKKKAEDGTGKE